MIRMEHVSKCFGEAGLIDGLSLEIGTRGILAVTGANGSGKTTLLRLLAGLETPDSGAVIRPDGCRIAYVFQDLRLVPTLTALENIELVLDRSRRGEAKRFLALVGLTEKADALPGALSGGMRQRIALARAFACGGDILLLDEPFSALDAEWRQRMADEVKRISETKPVVLVTHDPEDIAQLGCRVLSLSE